MPITILSVDDAASFATRDDVGSAKFAAPSTNTVVRQLGDKMYTDVPWSVLDFVDPVKHSGIKDGTLSGNLNIQFQKAIDSGENVISIPEGVLPVDTDGWTAMLSADGQKIVGSGKKSVIQNKVSSGLPVRPVILLTAGAKAAELRGVNVLANSTGLIDPVMASGQIAMGCAILSMADDVIIDDVFVQDAWDNGIGVGRYNLTTGSQTDGSPSDTLISRVRSRNCGKGIHTTANPLLPPHQAGAGVNNLTGTGTRIANCTDFFSVQGFIADYAGGAGTFMAFCRSYGAVKSSGDFPTYDARPGGQGYYIGSRVQMLECEAHDSQGDGFWFDGFSFYSIARGLRAKGCAQRGARIQGAYNDIEIMAEICSYGRPGEYAAITLDGSAVSGPDTFSHSDGIVLRNPVTYGAEHKWGVEVIGSFDVRGKMIGGFLNGTSGPINNTMPTFQAADYRVLGISMLQSIGLKLLQRTNNSYLAETFGDFQNNGNLILADLANPQKRLAMGYDPVNDLAVMQAIEAGMATKTMLLNPSGGDVGVGRGSWNAGHIRMGEYHLWIDAFDRLRIKSSAPTSDTDGTVVGSQT